MARRLEHLLDGGGCRSHFGVLELLIYLSVQQSETLTLLTHTLQCSQLLIFLSRALQHTFDEPTLAPIHARTLTCKHCSRSVVSHPSPSIHGHGFFILFRLVLCCRYHWASGLLLSIGTVPRYQSVSAAVRETYRSEPSVPILSASVVVLLLVRPPQLPEQFSDSRVVG